MFINPCQKAYSSFSKYEIRLLLSFKCQPTAWIVRADNSEYSNLGEKENMNVVAKAAVRQYASQQKVSWQIG